MTTDVAAACSCCGQSPAVSQDDGFWTVQCKTKGCPNALYSAGNCDRATAVRWWNEELAAAPVPV